jgi:hypothetical protein
VKTLVITAGGNSHAASDCQINVRPTSALPGYYAHDVCVTTPTGMRRIATDKPGQLDWTEPNRSYAWSELVNLRDRINNAIVSGVEVLDLRVTLDESDTQ